MLSGLDRSLDAARCRIITQRASTQQRALLPPPKAQVLPSQRATMKACAFLLALALSGLVVCLHASQDPGVVLCELCQRSQAYCSCDTLPVSSDARYGRSDA